MHTSTNLFQFALTMTRLGRLGTFALCKSQQQPKIRISEMNETFAKQLRCLFKTKNLFVYIVVDIL